MSQPIMVNCEVCASPATVEMNAHVDAAGKRIEWPKATVKTDGIYFSILCPTCGARDQLMAEPNDTA